MKIHPMAYAGSLLFMGVATMMFTMWVDRNIYDWPAIYAKLDRLEVLEPKAQIYEAMIDMNVGVWCELAVHYEWIEADDHAKAMELIASGPHKR